MAIRIARAIGIAGLCLISSGYAWADGAVVSTNPPAYGQGNNSLSQTPSGGLRVQLQAGGADVNPGVSGPTTPLGQQTISSATLAAAATSLTVPVGATIADFYPEGTGGTNSACVRFRDDGTAPTTTVGAPLQPGQLLLGYAGKPSGGPALSAIQFIAAAGATCTLTINYSK